MARKSFEEKAKETIVGAYSSFNSQCHNLSKLARNLNHLYLTGKIDPVYHREGLLETIQKILLRKNKANVLLTGPAGCGKTAIAEGLAAIVTDRRVAYQVQYDKARQAFNKLHKAWEEKGDTLEPEPEFVEPPKPLLSDLVIYDLSLTSLVGGTKYRGDFEERLNEVVKECRKNPNIILFIDEIHQIIKAGATEGNEGAAQMLKPALARKDIRCIGATTTAEAKVLEKDAAFMRRFNLIEVMPLVGDAAVETAEHILKNYCEYHQVSCPSVDAADLLAQVNFFMPTSVFPDSFINLVDETLAGAVFSGLSTVNMTHFNATLSRLTGKIIM